MCSLLNAVGSVDVTATMLTHLSNATVICSIIVQCEYYSLQTINLEETIYCRP